MTYGTMEKIQTVTITGSTAANIEFTNIPQTYNDLVIYISARSNRATGEDGLGLRLNNITTGYTYRNLTSNGSSVASANTNFEQVWASRIPAANSTGSTFSNNYIYIPNYAGTTTKSYMTDGVTENNGTEAYMVLQAINNSTTSAITSITLTSINASLVQHSTASIYGITRVPAGAKATGGIIYDDASYWYHVFNSTGVFTPSTNLSADYMIVGGGGGGGYGGPGGSGGGGGNVTVVSGASFLSATSYTATIGAGGNGGTSSSANGTTGTSSSFNSVTSNAGTGGAGGASGNGGSSLSTINGVTSSYTGGAIVSPDNQRLSGGGGAGAGMNGFTGGASAPGHKGGDGVTHPVGNFIGSTTYYGGGGNGGNSGTGSNGGWGAFLNFIPTSRSLGGGGWGGAQFPTSNPASAPTSGSANTGGGGGGGTWGNSSPIVSGADNGATGGSGVVIIRYAK